MLNIIILLIFTTSLIYIYMFISFIYKDEILIAQRLDNLKVKKKDAFDELSLPFYQRIIKPLGNGISEWLFKITPSGMKGTINEKLIAAGNPYNIGVNQWLLIRCIFCIIIPGISFFITTTLGLLGANTFFIIIGAFIISYLIPSFYLKHMTVKRQKEIINTLPDVLDLLTVSVEAGLAFDGAVSRLVNKMEGQLSKEFGRVLNEIKMGRSRKDALKEMSLRCNVTDLTTFIGSIIQADELGVSISNVLRIQSKQMRQKRRQRAQEKAMKAPVKMLFPLVFFIFPTIFSILLGPALIRILREFAK